MRYRAYLVKEKQRLRDDRSTKEVPSLYDFVEKVSPRFSAPRHLAALVDALERAAHEESRTNVNVPPQHGKTETIAHWLARYLLSHPDRVCAYVSYQTDRSKSISNKIRRYAQIAGVQIDPKRNRLEEWLTTSGGGLLATGIGGPLTGYGVSGILVIDDPIKNAEEAHSPVMREKAYEWYQSVALTRVHPGASVVVNMTRWHPDDLSGRVIKEGYESIVIPAIDDKGDALWEEHRPLQWLNAQRKSIGEYAWSSLYMQRPRPRSGTLFDPPSYCSMSDIPTRGTRASVGVDLAYSEKTYADYSVALTLIKRDSVCYVVDVQRKQVKAPKFAATLRMAASRYPGAPMTWHASGVEKGAADFLIAEGVPLKVEPPNGDKFIRAQPVSAAWNRGEILVPRDAPWAQALVDEVTAFTGVGDKNDDQVDALASAYSKLQGGDQAMIETRHPRVSSGWRYV